MQISDLAVTWRALNTKLQIISLKMLLKLLKNRNIRRCRCIRDIAKWHYATTFSANGSSSHYILQMPKCKQICWKWLKSSKLRFEMLLKSFKYRLTESTVVCRKTQTYMDR